MLLFAVVAAKKGSYYRTSLGVIKERSFWKFETIFPLLLFAVVFGMRYDVGTDHLTYLTKYVNRVTTERYELLFASITALCQKINLHYTVYFGILAFIQVFFFYYSFKDERYLYPFLSFFLFTTEDWMSWMNIIRQALAICVCLYSLKFIEEKKLWKYLLCILIAFLFHRSAVILAVFYPLLKNGKDYFKSVGLQLFLLGLVFAINKLFAVIILRLETFVVLYSSLLGSEAYADSYDTARLLESFTENEGTGMAFLFKIIVHVLIILYSTKLKIFYNSKRFNIIYFFFFIGLLTLYVFPPGAISISRPFRFFYIFPMIMYGYFAYFLYRTRKVSGRIVLLASLILAFLGMFYLSQITANEESHKWYQFFFQGNI